MAANSKHPEDVRIWIEKVIQSCTTVNQVISAKKLIRRYAIIYDDLKDITFNNCYFLRDLADSQISYIIHRNEKNQEK